MIKEAMSGCGAGGWYGLGGRYGGRRGGGLRGAARGAALTRWPALRALRKREGRRGGMRGGAGLLWLDRWGARARGTGPAVIGSGASAVLVPSC